MIKQLNQKQLTRKSIHGFSIVELTVVVLIVAIILVFSLPQIISSRRSYNFSEIREEVASSVRESRKSALTQQKPITLRYEDSGKRIITYGGEFGPLGDSRNGILNLSDGGVEIDQINYGYPIGVTPLPLGDGTVLTPLAEGIVEVTFKGDGSAVDSNGKPIDTALFFHHKIAGKSAAFAISIVGATGNVSAWEYSAIDAVYVEHIL